MVRANFLCLLHNRLQLALPCGRLHGASGIPRVGVSGEREVANDEGHLAGVLIPEVLHDGIGGTAGLALEVEELHEGDSTGPLLAEDPAVLTDDGTVGDG